MEQTNHNYSENINEVIKPGKETEFVFYIQQPNGQLTQKVLPSFMKTSFISRFGTSVPNTIEFDYWYSQEQSKFNNNGNFKTESILG